MKKIMSVLMILSIALTNTKPFYVNAEETQLPEDYYGYYEEINSNGYIVKINNSNIDLTFEFLGIDNSKGYYDLYSVELNDEEKIGFDSRLRADYSDETFGGYNMTEEKTGYYYISGGCNYDSLSLNNNIEEVYNVFNVTRNGLCLFEDGHFEATVLGGGYKKFFKSDELLKNDSDNNGVVDSLDALKILNAIVGNDTLTIEQKIQLDVMQSFNYIDENDYISSDYYSKATLTTGKALEILQQIVAE